MENVSRVKWVEVVSNKLLGVCHGACVMYGGDVYLHCGLASTKQSGQPESRVVKWNIESNLVSEITTSPDAPSLSHHTANLVGHIMVLTGGWDGKNRSSRVWGLSLRTFTWIQMEHLEELSRPPFGLSGHSCTMIRSSLFCVLGREGGLKIQRRFGDIFLLHLNINQEEEVGTYYWTEAPVKTKSRSGHTAILVPSLKHAGDLWGLFVFGGRDDESIHKCGQWKAEEVESRNIVNNTKLFNEIREEIKDMKPCAPTSLRYHTMNSIHKQCVIVTGGENFKSRNNVSDQLLVCVYSNGEAKWYCLRSGEKRVGHCSVSDESGCYILSGRNEKNLISNICKLEIR